MAAGVDPNHGLQENDSIQQGAGRSSPPTRSNKRRHPREGGGPANAALDRMQVFRNEKAGAFYDSG